MSHEGGYSTRLLRINSKYRTYDSASNTDFYVDFAASQVTEAVYRLALTRASFLYLFPNIDHFSSRLQITEGGIVRSIDVPIGQYTVEQLVAYINASALGWFMTLRFDEATRYVFVTPLMPFSMDGAESTNPMARLLGFSSGIVQYTTGETRNESVPDLGGPQLIFVESPTLGHGNCIDSVAAMGGGYLSLLETIPLSGIPHGYVVNWQANDLVSSDLDFTTAQSLRRIHIRLTDGHNHVLSLPKNQEVELIVKLFYR